MMDQASMSYTLEQMELLQDAALEGGYGVQEIDPQQTPIPTFIIDAVSQYQEDDWHIACNVLPMHRSSDTFVCVHLYLTLSAPIPAEKLEQMEQLVKLHNERMMVGNLLLFSNRVCIKYTLFYEYGGKMDEDMFRYAIHMTRMQADIVARKCDDLLNGNTDLATLLQKNPFSD